MKKSTKALLAIGAAIAAPILINKAIEKRARKRIMYIEKGEIFSWDYGDIHYSVDGDKLNPPILLIHGIYPGASLYEWDAVAKRLSENYCVYSIDLLGFGFSCKPALDYSSYFYVRLIKDFIENVICAPVIAAASLHSAALLAMCAELNPEDFSRIVFVSPTGLGSDTALADGSSVKTRKALESFLLGTSIYNIISSKKVMQSYLVGSKLYQDLTNAELERIYLSAHHEGAGGKYALAALLSKFYNVDIKQVIGRLETPFKVIVGEPNSVPVLYDGLDELLALKVVKMDGAGLLPHIDFPKEFIDEIEGGSRSVE